MSPREFMSPVSSRKLAEGPHSKFFLGILAVSILAITIALYAPVSGFLSAGTAESYSSRTISGSAIYPILLNSTTLTAGQSSMTKIVISVSSATTGDFLIAVSPNGMDIGPGQMLNGAFPTAYSQNAIVIKYPAGNAISRANHGSIPINIQLNNAAVGTIHLTAHVYQAQPESVGNPIYAVASVDFQIQVSR